MDLPALLSKLSRGIDLSDLEAHELISAIIDGSLKPAGIGAVLVSLNHKGIAVTELAAFAEVLAASAIKINPQVTGLLDTCGTGGDGSGTFNISTVTAFVLAGCDLNIAKHGNRAVSSSCGSADLLEELGVNLDLSPTAVEQCIEGSGIGFLFAPAHHPAFKAVVPVRRELGIRTIFNLLGPLLNPARLTSQVIGVYAPELTELFAATLQRRGVASALVVHGDGLDELTLCGVNRISRLREGKVETFELHPEECGLPGCRLVELTTGTRSENAAVFQEVLQGERSPRRDIVLLNAAAGLLAADQVADWPEGISTAAAAIDSGQAWSKFEELRRLSHDLS